MGLDASGRCASDLVDSHDAYWQYDYCELAMVRAMRRVGTGGADIDTALQSVKDFPGATGSITITADGDRTSRSVRLLQYKGNTPQPE